MNIVLLYLLFTISLLIVGIFVFFVKEGKIHKKKDLFAMLIFIAIYLFAATITSNFLEYEANKVIKMTEQPHQISKDKNDDDLRRL